MKFSYYERPEIYITIDGIKYQWNGGLGAILFSRERGIKKGDVRIIGGLFFYASNVANFSYFQKPRIEWTVVDVKVSEIEELKRSLLWER